MESTHVPWWNRVTVIVTTSPVRSNPDVSLVEEVFQSFFLVPGMVNCRKIIVCDGFRTVLNTKKVAWKSGKIPEDHITRYEAYKGRLRQYVAEAQRCHQQQQHEGVISAEGNSSETSKSDASSSSSTTSSEEPRDSPSSSSATNAFSTNPRVVPAFVNTELLELSTRHGFAFAVRAAIAVVQTEYVMVIQHDRRFCSPLNVGALLEDMDAYHARYVEYCETQSKKLRAFVEALSSNTNTTTTAPSPSSSSSSSSFTPSSPLSQSSQSSQSPSQSSLPAHPFPNPINVASASRLPRWTPSPLVPPPSPYANSFFLGPPNPRERPVPMHCVSLPVTFTMAYERRFNSRFPKLRIGEMSLPAPAMRRDLLNRLFPQQTSTASTSISTSTSTSIDNTNEWNGSGDRPERTCALAILATNASQVQAKSSTSSPSTSLTSSLSPLSSVSSSSSPPSFSLSPSPQLPVASASSAPLVTPRLLPMLAWLDTTHVARTDYYRYAIFDRAEKGLVEMVRRGEFPEDKLGQYLYAILRQTQTQAANLTAKSFEKSDEALTSSSSVSGESKSVTIPKSSENGLANDATTTSAAADFLSGSAAASIDSDPLFLPRALQRDLMSLGIETAKLHELKNVEEALTFMLCDFGLWLLEDYEGTFCVSMDQWARPEWVPDTKWHVRKIAPGAAGDSDDDDDDDDDEDDDDVHGDKSRDRDDGSDDGNGDDEKGESRPREGGENGDDSFSGSNDQATSTGANAIGNTNPQWSRVPPGYVATAPPRPNVLHLDGKGFYNDAQKDDLGYVKTTDRYAMPIRPMISVTDVDAFQPPRSNSTI